MNFLIIIIILLLIILGVILVFYFKNKNKQDTQLKAEIAVLENKDSYFPEVQIIESTDIVPLEKNKIIDKKVINALTTIDSTVPKTVNIVKKAKRGTEFLDKNKEFFSAAKKETKNMLKVSKSDKLYGMQMIKDKNSNRQLFKKPVEFTKENALAKNVGTEALVDASFNALSIVVGQHYMNEINDKLENIEQEINEIVDYLDSEYNGKVMYIVSKIKELMDNKEVSVKNDFIKDKRYDDVMYLERECSELLGSANEEIKKNIQDGDIEYKDYIKKLQEINKWIIRQKLLLKLLFEIGELRYYLAEGFEDTNICHSQYNNYLSQCNMINQDLEKWNIFICEKYGIDINSSRRKGKFYVIRKNTIGKLNENWAYKKLDKDIIQMIENQVNTEKMLPYKKQGEVIKILKYNDEYYNLLK